MKVAVIPIINRQRFLSALLIILMLCWLAPATAADSRSQLVVGTTGDYPPLTVYHSDSQKYTGSAIQLVEAFADDSQRQIKFVATTWSTLSQDLQQGKFQMAVGGISKTPDRQRQFLLSQPLYHFGKVALVRCGEQQRYDSLAKIDRYPTRIIENRGGSNERFAQLHIRHAILTIVPDNAMTFDYLTNNWADVMFTDSTEAVYRQQLNSGLCAVNPDQPYTDSVKVFLFSKDQKLLQQQFNAWLKKHRPH